MALSSPYGYAFGMQRKWRIGRLVLTGLFLALAGLAYGYWPATPRWGVEEPYQSIIGYSPARKQLLTTLNPFVDADGKRQGRTFNNESETIGLYGLDLDNGNKSFIQSIECPSTPDTLLSVSPDGQTLVVANSDVRLFNIGTGQQFLTVDTSGEQAAVVFSADNQRLVVVTWKHIQIWDLGKREMIFRVPFFMTLEQRVLAKYDFDEHDAFENRPKCKAISLSHDNRHLAILSYGQLVNYDVAKQHLITQEVISGVPRYLSDGKLGMIGTNPERGEVVYQQLDLNLQPSGPPVRPMTHEEIRKLIKSVRESTIVYPHYLHIGQASCLYAKESINSLQWPSWMPNSLSKIVDDLLKFRTPTWIVSYCDLNSNRIVKKFVVPTDSFTEQTPQGRAFSSFYALASSHKSPPFVALPVDHEAWVVLSGDHSIELWPLLTWWRPWYCWATVAGLAAIACYFVWYGRRVVAAR